LLGKLLSFYELICDILWGFFILRKRGRRGLYVFKYRQTISKHV
jgi:DUF2075 family protein